MPWKLLNLDVKVITHVFSLVGVSELPFCCLQGPEFYTKDNGITELPGGTAYATASSTNEDQMRIEQEQVNRMAQQTYATVTGNMYAHENFEQRLAFSQNLHRSNYPCTPVMTRTYQGTNCPPNTPYQLR